MKEGELRHHVRPWFRDEPWVRTVVHFFADGMRQRLEDAEILYDRPALTGAVVLLDAHLQHWLKIVPRELRDLPWGRLGRLAGLCTSALMTEARWEPTGHKAAISLVPWITRGERYRPLPDASSYPEWKHAQRLMELRRAVRERS
ncbi:MAG: hypothetical protein AMXMBFR58_36650 [Phycisphaerae bacterium]